MVAQFVSLIWQGLFKGPDCDLTAHYINNLEDLGLSPMTQNTQLLIVVDRHIRLLSSQGMGLCAKHKGLTE